MSTERILIDGYNLLHAGLGSADIGPSLERARTRFLDNLAAVPSRVRGKFEVIFDAMQAKNPIGERMRHHGIAVFFARDRSADDYIGREVSRVAAKSGSARSVLVVSSDRVVQGHAKSCGARVVSSADFLRELDHLVHPQEGDTSRRAGTAVDPRVANEPAAGTKDLTHASGASWAALNKQLAEEFADIDMSAFSQEELAIPEPKLRVGPAAEPKIAGPAPQRRASDVPVTDMRTILTADDVDFWLDYFLGGAEE